jgi:hypothetical protein
LQPIKDRGIVFHGWRDKLNSVMRVQGITDEKIRALTAHRGEAMTDLYTKFEGTDFTDSLEAQVKVL